MRISVDVTTPGIAYRCMLFAAQQRLFAGFALLRGLREEILQDWSQLMIPTITNGLRELSGSLIRDDLCMA